MLATDQALAAASRSPPREALPSRRVLVVGAHSHLGWAVIEALTASGRIDKVATLVNRPIRTAFHGFTALDDRDGSLHAFAADTAVITYDRPRPRRAGASEAAFVQPDPKALCALASRLLAAGARSLVVAMPHAPSLMPAALQQGLASLDEAEVAALGFQQLVFMRMAQSGLDGAEGLSLPQRLAHWMLAQLHWLVPRSEQPVRLTTVAKVAAALALQLPSAPSATRVFPSALMAQAAQTRDVHALVQAWLDGTSLPAASALPLPRM